MLCPICDTQEQWLFLKWMAYAALQEEGRIIESSKLKKNITTQESLMEGQYVSDCTCEIGSDGEENMLAFSDEEFDNVERYQRREIENNSVFRFTPYH